MDATFAQQRRLGFNHLLQELQLLEQCQQRNEKLPPRCHATYLATHPFNLPVPPVMSGSVPLPGRSIKLIGYPGYTNSTNGCAAVLADALAAREGSKITLLRIMYGQAEPGDEAKHNVYFEAGTTREIFIVGGCTDYSGGGRRGTAFMKEIFCFLSDLFGISIKEVRVPYPMSELVRIALCQAYNTRDQA